MGPDPFCRPDIPVLNIVVETPALFVALVVFCSVGRIGPSPPNRPIRGGAFTVECTENADEGREFLSTDDTDVLRWSRSKKILSPPFSFGDLCASVSSVDKTQAFSARF